MAVPTLRRRLLAAELRKLREEHDLTLDEAADGTDVAKSTLSRIETGRITARPVVVRALLAKYNVTGEQAELLLQLARDAGKKGWWLAYSDVLSSQYADYIALEAEAAAIRNYEPQFVPGLLQTPEYAHAVIDAVLITASEEEVERRVQVRVARQPRLSAPPPMDFWVIVDESVLRRPTGGHAVMADQIRHILEVARLPNVTLQVLPADVPAHPGMLGSFSIIEFADQAFGDVVYVEGMAGELFVEEEDEARRCNLVYNHLRTKALDKDKSAALIKTILKTHTT